MKLRELTELERYAILFFEPVVPLLGEESARDMANGFVEGYAKAVEQVITILNKSGDLGDGGRIWKAVNALHEGFEGTARERPEIKDRK